VLRQSYNVDIGYTYRYMKLSVLWLQPQYRYNDICNRYQHCNFREAQAESSLMMIYVNRIMLEQLL